jgi:hypothetical protein
VVERGFPTRQKCRVNEPRLGVVCRGLLEMFSTGAATGPLMVGVHLPDPYIVVHLLPFHDLPLVPRLDLRLGPTVANIHPHDLQKTLNIKSKIIIQCCGSGMFIPDPDFSPSRISDPGSKNSTATKERD